MAVGLHTFTVVFSGLQTQVYPPLDHQTKFRENLSPFHKLFW